MVILEEVTLVTTRRKVITNIAAATLLIRPLTLQAQQQNADVTSIFSEALKVRRLATSIETNTINGRVIDYLATDYQSRRTVLGWAGKSGFFKNAESATAYVRRIPSVLPKKYPVEYNKSMQESQIVVIETLERLNLPIAPLQTDVSPTELPTVAPMAPTPDNDLRIFGDILFETVGITVGDTSLLKEFMDGNKEAKDLFDKLIKAVTTKSWEDAIPIIENFFRLAIGSNVVKKMGEFAVRKMTFRLAAGCVPVVGWVYLSAAAIVSIMKNYHRFSFASSKDSV